MISNDLFTGIIPVAFVNHKNVDSPTILIANSKGDGISTRFISIIKNIASIKSVTLVSYNSDYAS